MRRALCLILAAATVTGAATACVGPAPIPTLPPQPTATPVFASEEEALAAAEASYTAYINASDEIASDGGLNPERIESLASGQLLVDALESYEAFRENGWHLSGQTELVATILQAYDPLGGEGSLVVYLCVDVSAVDVQDSSGASVVSPDRPDRQAFETTFDVYSLAEVIPTTRETWDTDAVCP